MNQKLLEEIGQILYNSRVKKNYSLENASENTKISIRNLEYLEKGLFHKLPGEFYQKSFIKIYSQSLKINTEKLLSMYQEAIRQHSEFTKEEEKQEIEIKKFNYFFSDKKLPTVSFLAISLIIFSFIIFFKIYTPNKEKNVALLKDEINNFQDENQSDNFIKEIESLKKEKETPIKNTNIDIDDIDFSNNFQNSQIYSKEIFATKDVWLEIKDINGNSIIATLLKEQETFSIPNETGLIISASNAGSIKIRNGDTLSDEIGSFGTILNSVSLDSLLNKY